MERAGRRGGQPAWAPPPCTLGGPKRSGEPLRRRNTNMRLRRRNNPEPEMTCRELVELVTDYLELRLAPGGLERFENHLELCAPWVTYIEQIRQSVAVVGTLSEETLPQGAAYALLAEFRDWKRTRG